MFRNIALAAGRQLRQSSFTAQRGFSAAAAEEVSAPIRQFGLPARYAAALYVAATKAGALSAVDAELKQVTDIANSNAAFKGFLVDPSMAKTVKATKMAELLEAMKFSQTSKNFFGVLASNGRLSETMNVAEKFENLMRASRGEVMATVTTAEPLTAAELADVKKACEKKLAAGQKLVLATKVDPSIIGGLILDIGEKHMDLSINSKIRKMEILLSESI